MAGGGTPAGTLPHQLEGRRHDLFIELAERGDIDLVFFGTTDTEIWWWPDRGRSVWDQVFGSLNAANFGSQGTQPHSLLWRMRSGELDGCQAKLIVLQACTVVALGERFFDADGTFRRETWSLEFDNRGIQKAAFEIWAQELQPWLDRFVR